MQASYRHKWLPFVLVTALILGLTAGAFAQIDEGTISGKVADPTGAVLTNVTVTVTSVTKGTVRTTTTNAEGLYTVSNLKADTYNVNFEASGFATLTQQIVVQVGAKIDISPSMKLAGTTTTLEVLGESAVQVQTTSAEVGQVVSEQQVAQLPSLNRNPYDFATSAGNATSNDYSSSRGVSGLNLNGTRATATGIQLDGAENSDLFGAQVNPGGIPMDATQEFKVVTNGMTAEYGRAGSGVVNVVSKSGTNNFHGSAYEVYRGSALASNDYNSNAFGQAKGRFVRNQFGYSLGGPIVKNKLFFYTTTEWIRVRSSANRQSLVPSSDFINLSAQNTQDYMSAYGDLGVQPSSFLTAADVRAKMSAATITNNPLFFGLPAATPVFGLVRFSVPRDSGGGSPQNTYNTFNRIDWTISDKTSLYGRFARYDEIDPAGSNSYSPYSAFNTAYTGVNNTFLVTVTHIFTPNLVTETKLNFNRFNQTQPLGPLGDVPNLFFNGAAAATIGGVNLALPGYLPFSPGSTIPFGGPQNYGTISNATTWNKGAHTLKFGGYFMYTKDNHMFGAYENAVQMLSSSGWGKSLDNFLNGNLSNFQVAVYGGGAMPCYRDTTTGDYIPTAACTMNLPVKPAQFARSNRYHDAALFAQDTWKATNRLTLNYGIRWEYYGPQHNNKSDLDSNFYLGSGSTFFDKVANGYVTTAPNSPDKSLWAAKYKNFAPRVGFAYDVFGDGKTSLRGGFGIGYERNFGNVTYNVIQNPPAQLNLTFSSADNGGVPIPVSANNFGVFGTGTGTKQVPNVSLRAVQQNIPTSYYETWNFGAEREVVNGTVLDVTYNGSHGVHLYSIANINPNYAGNLFLGYGYAGARLNTQYGAINYRGAMGGSKYNGLNVGLRSTNLKDLGLTLTANYTYSHSIDNVSTQFNNSDTSQNANLGFVSAFFPGFDRGSSDFDVRHRFTTSMVWDLPFAKRSKGIVRAIAGGWQVTPMFTVATGVPYSLYDCTNAYSTCIYASFPDGQTPNAKGSFGQNVGTNDFVWETFPTVSMGAYANPDLGISDFPTCTGLEGAGCTWPTTSGRNHFRAPGNWNLDMGLGKSFKIGERHTITFRADGFNIMNHASTYLSLPADVASYSLADGTPYVSAYKSGRRFFNLTLRYTF